MDANTQTAQPASATALAYLNAALGIGQALATDAAAIAAGTGNAKTAAHITNGLSIFSSLSGPVQDLEQLAIGIFGMFSALAAGHAASKAAG